MEGAPRPARSVLAAIFLLAAPMSARAQAPPAPVLDGTVFVGDTVMSSGTVALHHLTDGGQAELDSVTVRPDGSFAFSLPTTPDPGRGDVYFASIRRHGVLYFGPAITAAAQLDSIYEIQAYDTTVAPVSGASVPLQSRSVFFEPDSAGWRVTDLFQVRNEGSKTLVAAEGGRVWAYPLPDEATEVTTGQGELAFDAAQYEDGGLVVRAALPPGERLFVVRYRLASPLVTLPAAGAAESYDVLVREPAPLLDVTGLELVDRVELEAGSTYLRFSGSDVSAPVRLVATDERAPPRVEWIAVVLALVLTAAGVFVLRGARASGPAPAISPDRRSLLREVAYLDEAFDPANASAEERATYERRRTELVRRIRALS